jgi:hypothetical protein
VGHGLLLALATAGSGDADGGTLRRQPVLTRMPRLRRIEMASMSQQCPRRASATNAPIRRSTNVRADSPPANAAAAMGLWVVDFT